MARLPNRDVFLAAAAAAWVALGVAACTNEPIIIGIDQSPIAADDASTSAARADAAPDAWDDGGVPNLYPVPNAPSDPSAPAFDAAPVWCSSDAGCPNYERCYGIADGGGICGSVLPLPPVPPPGG